MNAMSLEAIWAQIAGKRIIRMDYEENRYLKLTLEDGTIIGVEEYGQYDESGFRIICALVNASKSEREGHFAVE